MTRQLMSPTCPITTWFRLRQTFWTEPPIGPSLPQSLTACPHDVHCVAPRAIAAAQPGPPRVLKFTRPGCPESGGTGGS